MIHFLIAKSVSSILPHARTLERPKSRFSSIFAIDCNLNLPVLTKSTSKISMFLPNPRRSARFQHPPWEDLTLNFNLSSAPLHHIVMKLFNTSKLSLMEHISYDSYLYFELLSV